MIKRCRRIVEAVPCDDDLLLNNGGLAIAFKITLRSEWHGPAPFECCTRFSAFIHHADFQCRSTANHLLGRRDILNSWQLHDDAVQTLLLDHGLGNTQFINAVVQGCYVLFERLLLDSARCQWLNARYQLYICSIRGLHSAEFGELLLHNTPGSFSSLCVAEANFNGLPIAADAAMAHIFLSKSSTDITCQRFRTLGQSSLHVHLQHEMHATAQIQPQVHGRSVQCRQPSRGARQQIKRHDKTGVGCVRVQRLLDGILGFKLGVGIAKACLDRSAFHRN